MNALPTTGELFVTNQASPETERCYQHQLRNHAAHCVAVESASGWKMSKEKAFIRLTVWLHVLRLV